jgi:hypothetical protein
MKGDGILRVTQALRARLLDAVRASGDLTGTVFVGPLDDTDAAGASLILFLYRLAPNASLRNAEHRVASATPPPVVGFDNSLPLDLYYLVTVGTRPGMSEEPLLRVLGFAMQALQAMPEITGPPVEQEVVRLTLEPLTTDEVSRIWALFPTANYRTSIAYLASPVWIDPAADPTPAREVETDSLDVGVRHTVPVD